jgi:sugar/nucleoside kinase (ribokinase family)
MSESNDGAGGRALVNGQRVSRAALAKEASRALRGATLAPALVGFDGFIDSIVHMVDRRTQMTPGGYERLRTIEAFAARCAAAAGKSTNIERVLIESRFGGNGPLMAGALASLGAPTTFIGAIEGAEPGSVHPVFVPFASRCERVVPIAPPSETLCLEFDDGKLMFNDTANVQAVTWDAVMQRVGMQRLVEMVESARLLGIVNWSLLGGVEGLWTGLRDRVLPRVSRTRRRLFVDLSDPAKRTDDDLRRGLSTLASLDGVGGLDVTLGLNLAEAQRVAATLGVSASHKPPGGEAIQALALIESAEAIRAALAIDAVVIHPREGAAGATSGGDRAFIDGPLTRTPKLSTGAGDHFNGGCALGQMLGLPLHLSLAFGVGVSGAYVRDAQSPSRARLAEFLDALPAPERSPRG